jgi:hypothetical protein
MKTSDLNLSIEEIDLLIEGLTESQYFIESWAIDADEREQLKQIDLLKSKLNIAKLTAREEE